jgi:hypothetical protein
MSYFTDPMAALEEAEYLRRKKRQRTMCVVEVEPNMIVVVPKKVAAELGGIILETCVPFEENHNIYD